MNESVVSLVENSISEVTNMTVRGFSLIELIIVIALISILTAAATLDFNSWQKKYNIEAQVKEMLVDLTDVRMSAIKTKTKYRVVLNPNSYTFTPYSTETALSAKVGFSKNLKYPIQRFASGSLSAFSNTPLEIDERGYTASWTDIAIGVGLGTPAYNCISVSFARTNMGRINGTNCEFQ